MSKLQNLVNKTEKLLKPLPHIPNHWRETLAKNAWWLLAVSVFLMVLAIISTIQTIFTALALFNVPSEVFGYYVPKSYSTQWVWMMMLKVAEMVIIAFVAGVAVKDLKAMKYSGWNKLLTLLFITAVISVINIFFSPGQIAWDIIGIAAGLYLLFEIRNYYSGISHSTIKTKSVKKAKAKKK